MANLPPEDPSSWNPPPSDFPPPQTPPPGQQPPANWAPTPSPVQGGFSTPTPDAPYPRNSQATLALVLSIISFFGFCCLTSVPGTVLGFQELRAIDRGETDPSNRGLALAAAIIGGAGLVLFVLALAFLSLVLFVGASAP